MAAWPNLTTAEKKKLKKSLENRLQERGIDVSDIDFDPAGLGGRYRLYVVSPDFAKLDYSDRMEVVTKAITDAWDRRDELRITLMFPLSPDEVPSDAKQRN